MAHTCPECYQLCHCNGDIDDIDFGEDEKCLHCLGRYDDCDEFYDEDYA